MPQTRSKRKAVTQEHKDSKDAEESVLGGMAGGYRASETRTSEEEHRHDFSIPFRDKVIVAEKRGRDLQQDPTLIFTHGAGGGISNAATRDFTAGFAQSSSIICFQGTMNLSSRVKTFKAVTEHVEFSGALGGRSMGARAAVMTCDDATKACVLVSYPLIGGKNGDTRDQILLDLRQDVDVLFIIGTKDHMCPLDRLDEVRAKMKAGSWIVHVQGQSDSSSHPFLASRVHFIRLIILESEVQSFETPRC